MKFLITLKDRSDDYI